MRIFSKRYITVLCSMIVLGTLIFSACAPLKTPDVVTSTQAETSSPAPIPPQQTQSGENDYQSYQNEAFAISFQFPVDWQGPDVYEWESGVRIAIGSDVVYPYGTDRTEQVYTQSDAYYVTIQFDQRDDHLAGAAYLDLLDVADGEVFETPRSLATRIRSINVGDYTGIEYIVTLPESAQTEIVFLREIVIFDQDMHFLTITGSPNNVTVADGGNWREAYKRVDAQYNDVFNRIVNSISLP